MFERYTESARRTLFFARYETSMTGGTAIETEHLLLGLLREHKGISARLLSRVPQGVENIRRKLEQRLKSNASARVATSVEIPFSEQSKQALQYATEEADRLRHTYIGTEHLLLGLLREEGGLAAAILVEEGLQLGTVRDGIVRMLTEPVPPPSPQDTIDDVIFRIKALVERLGRMMDDDGFSRSGLVENINRELDRLKGDLDSDSAPEKP
jgi:ATP-dependent Clp protease ATP-binding subunit ClpC